MLERHIGIIAHGLTDLSTVTSLGYFPTGASALVSISRVFNLSPLFWSSLLEVRLHHGYVWRRVGVLCTVWEQKAAAICDEAQVLCLRTDSAQDEES